AVVIGINQYIHGIATLQTAVQDAQSLGVILNQAHGYYVKTVTDHAASLKKLRHLFHEQLPAQITKRDRLLIYFAGHGIAKETSRRGTDPGVEGPVGYLIPQDAQPMDERTFLPMQEMYQALAKLPCQHLLLILDCCFAGAFRWASTRDILIPEKMYRQRFERFELSSAWQVLTSAAYDQQALDMLRDNRMRGHEQGAHSPFTLALYEALDGKADLICDQVITATELYLYLRDRVEGYSNEQQTPGLWPLPKHDHGEFFFFTKDFDSKKLEEAPAPSPECNPYRGLQAYEEHHGSIFFGRDLLIQRLYREHVIVHPLTIVVGASGTGKSSLVKAGLVPYLKQAQFLKRRKHFTDVSTQVTEEWQILSVVRPGHDPRLALAQLKQAANQSSVSDWLAADSNRHGLVVVDQAEELITLAPDPIARDRFIHHLETTLAAHPQQIHCILTVRMDFEALVKQLFSLKWQSDWDRTYRLVVPPMTQDELRVAIEGPANEAVLHFEPAGLVDALINEVVQMPGALPLLSFTLSELYLKCVERFRQGELNRALTQKDYEQLGQVSGALRYRANQTFDALDSAGQRTLRNVMLRMVALDGGELARRRVPRTELMYTAPEENERVEAILEQLIAQR
ncbi:MAG: caspase family protein, partial [Cyanobacteria bacterium J06555_13]